jgi:transcriptional regulator with XRE-family HTH domain
MSSYLNKIVPGQIVAARREELSLTQAELAQRLDYPNANFISMIEVGKSLVPLDKAVEIASALEMEPAWFVKRVFRDRYPNAYSAVFGLEPEPATPAPDRSEPTPGPYRVRL